MTKNSSGNVKYNYSILMGYNADGILNLLWSPELKKNFLQFPSEIEQTNLSSLIKLKNSLSTCISTQLSAQFSSHACIVRPNIKERSRLNLNQGQKWLEISVEAPSDAAFFEKYLPGFGLICVIIGNATQQMVTVLAALLLPGSNAQNYVIGGVGGVSTLILGLMIYFFSHSYANMKDTGRLFDSFCCRKDPQIETAGEEQLESAGLLSFKNDKETLKAEKIIAGCLLFIFVIAATAANAITYYESAVSMRAELIVQNKNVSETFFSADAVYYTALVTLAVGAINSVIVLASFSLKTVEPFAKVINQCQRLFHSARPQADASELTHRLLDVRA